LVGARRHIAVGAGNFAWVPSQGGLRTVLFFDGGGDPCGGIAPLGTNEFRRTETSSMRTVLIR